MPQYRKIFPSYDWDDAWYVNQIVNLPDIVGKENIGFVKDVPNEEVKQNDVLIKKWIDSNMEGCSCLVLFCGERTCYSRWVKYELEQASKKNMGRIIVYLAGMKHRNGDICQQGQDPYAHHGMYVSSDTPDAYVVNAYNWIEDNGLSNIGAWIEDACTRAGK